MLREGEEAMPRVTKEMVKALIDAGCFPPRHNHGCPKNYARMFPLLYAARGLTVEDIKERVTREYESLPCTCRK